jgi:glycosyltransferase involved in cell wall biosynthesis
MKMKKTVLFTVDLFDISGVTTLTLQYMRVLHRHGYHTVIVGRQGNIDDPHKYFPRSSVYIIPGTIRGSIIGRLFDGVAYLDFLHRIYRKHPIRCVHLSTPWSAVYTLLHPRTWRLHRIITFHGAYDLESMSARTGNTTKKPQFGDVVRFFIQWVSLSCAHTIICCSTYSKKLVSRHFRLFARQNNHIRVIPGYIDATPFVEHQRDGRDTTLHVLTIGRAEPRKGISLLLAATAVLRNKHVPVHVTIASPVDRLKSGDVLDTYERLQLFSSVRLYHAVHEQQKYMLMRDADIFVMPSVDLETFGLTILECLAVGLPVIGTPAGAIPEILQKVDKRLIAETVSVASLEKTIRWYYHLPLSERRQLSQKAIHCVQTHYSYNLVAPMILSAYQNA